MITAARRLEIYRRNLKAYEAEGDAEKVRIQKALIRKIEAGRLSLKKDEWT